MSRDFLTSTQSTAGNTSHSETDGTNVRASGLSSSSVGAHGLATRAPHDRRRCRCCRRVAVAAAVAAAAVAAARPSCRRLMRYSFLLPLLRALSALFFSLCVFVFCSAGCCCCAAGAAWAVFVADAASLSPLPPPPPPPSPPQLQRSCVAAVAVLLQLQR